MQKITDSFPDDPSFQMLYILARCFDPYIPTAAKSRELFGKSVETSKPEWVKYFDGKWTLVEICKDLDLSVETRRQVWQLLNPWLNRVLYQTSAFIPHINEENAHNLALGHPISLWLYENVDLLDAACSVGMMVSQGTCASLIRLPQLIIRYRMILAPVLAGFHQKSTEELKELRPLYFDLA